mgnify:CR=1 FL=1
MAMVEPILPSVVILLPKTSIVAMMMHTRLRAPRESGWAPWRRPGAGTAASDQRTLEQGAGAAVRGAQTRKPRSAHGPRSA